MSIFKFKSDQDLRKLRWSLIDEKQTVTIILVEKILREKDFFFLKKENLDYIYIVGKEKQRM